jgi:hypothetical protein
MIQTISVVDDTQCQWCGTVDGGWNGMHQQQQQEEEEEEARSAMAGFKRVILIPLRLAINFHHQSLAIWVLKS